MAKSNPAASAASVPRRVEPKRSSPLSSVTLPRSYLTCQGRLHDLDMEGRDQTARAPSPCQFQPPFLVVQREGNKGLFSRKIKTYRTFRNSIEQRTNLPTSGARGFATSETSQHMAIRYAVHRHERSSLRATKGLRYEPHPNLSISFRLITPFNARRPILPGQNNIRQSSPGLVSTTPPASF
jgi:hypothetical protein